MRGYNYRFAIHPKKENVIVLKPTVQTYVRAFAPLAFLYIGMMAYGSYLGKKEERETLAAMEADLQNQE